MLYSCMHSTSVSKTHQIFINKELPEVSLININIWQGTVVDEGNYYKLNFDGYKYGNSYLLGVKKLKKKTPDEFSRLELVKNGEVIAKYSINEILKMDHQIMDDSIVVYQIPELL